jgi:hypothetical protein
VAVQQITTLNLPELLDHYEKIISELILYIPNAKIDQDVVLLDRFALIQELEKIQLKIDTSSQFCKENL